MPRLGLYLAYRFGNDQEGPNGYDTVFLVRARALTSAAELVDHALRDMPHVRVHEWCDGVFEIGVSRAVNAEPSREEDVLLGPDYRFAVNNGRHPEWRRWKPEGPWIFQGPCSVCHAFGGPYDDRSTVCSKCGSPLRSPLKNDE